MLWSLFPALGISDNAHVILGAPQGPARPRAGIISFFSGVLDPPGAWSFGHGACLGAHLSVTCSRVTMAQFGGSKVQLMLRGLMGTVGFALLVKGLCPGGCPSPTGHVAGGEEGSAQSPACFCQGAQGVLGARTHPWCEHPPPGPAAPGRIVAELPSPQRPVSSPHQDPLLLLLLPGPHQGASSSQQHRQPLGTELPAQAEHHVHEDPQDGQQHHPQHPLPLR